ncbi:hypothetical protein ACFX2I_021947 [Malus domestica]|uniref:Uncharacterized protein n=1 Tax=Malus domestica TaxID=3750 RepID=A0A498HLU0_MALDO|nr:hypothetical protein DVH24_013241 [Malus domestica]
MTFYPFSEDVEFSLCPPHTVQARLALLSKLTARSKLSSPSTVHRLNDLDAQTAYSNALFGPSAEEIVFRASLSINGPRSGLSREVSTRIGSGEAGWGFLDWAGEGLDRDDSFLVWGEGVPETGAG